MILNVPFSDRQGALSDSKGAPSRTLGRSKKSKKYPLSDLHRPCTDCVLSIDASNEMFEKNAIKAWDTLLYRRPEMLTGQNISTAIGALKFCKYHSALKFPGCHPC